MRSAATVQWHKTNNARGRNAAGFCFGGGLGRVERVEGRNKLGDPAKPLILLAIAGPVPKNTLHKSIGTPRVKIFLFSPLRC